jgi:NhaP-type Na+/H+ or K+/H+ antiporter
MPLDPLPALAAIVVLGGAAQWLGWRIRLPAILPLLAVGFLIGPVTGLVDVDSVFGPLLRPFVSLAVALILFEGGLTLHLKDLAGTGAVVRNLVTIGAAVTWVVVTASAHWLANVPFDLALLAGAILVLTGPTVVVPLVRHIRPSGPTGPILRWEGILIDPIGALLALLVFDVITTDEQSVWRVATSAAMTLLVGAGSGTAAALLLGQAIRSHWLPERLHVPIALTAVAAAFAGANELQHESGLFAVTVLGIVLANTKGVDVSHIAEFKEDLGNILLAVLFVVLSARIPLHELTGLGYVHLMVVGIAILVARPLAVACSTIRTGLSWRDRVFLMAMAPRGIVAAAVSSEFALQLESAGRDDAGTLTSLVFACIIGTVSCYGLLSGTVARWLGIADANPRGILFVGADRATREIARVLQQIGVPTLLVDTNQANVQAARDLQLRAWHGSILSDRFFDEVDLAGIGRLCATTGSDEVNLLAVRRFRGIFDGRALFQTPLRARGDGRFGLAEVDHGRWLFRADATAERLQGMIASGAVVATTRLSEKYGPDQYAAEHGRSALPLFAVQPDGTIAVATTDAPLPLRPGATVVSLVPPAR